MSPETTPRELAAELPGADGARATMRLIVNQTAQARGLPAPWTVDLPDDARRRISKRVADLGDLTGWSAIEFGALYEQIINPTSKTAHGVYYTPQPVADFMSRFSLDVLIRKYGDHEDPFNLLQIHAFDPSCGAGVLLVAAARHLAHAFAARCFNLTDPPPEAVRVVMPDVIRESIYGLDIDLVAVDLAKSTLWLEAGGELPLDELGVNVACGNTLHGDLPPKLAERFPNNTGELPLEAADA